MVEEENKGEYLGNMNSEQVDIVEEIVEQVAEFSLADPDNVSGVGHQVSQPTISGISYPDDSSKTLSNSAKNPFLGSSSKQSFISLLEELDFN